MSQTVDAPLDVFVDNEGDNILPLTKGQLYTFVLEVPVVSVPKLSKIGIVDPDQVNTKGDILGWKYSIQYRSLDRRPMWTTESAGGKEYYNLYLKVGFDGTDAETDIDLDLALHKRVKSVPMLVYMVDLLSNVDYDTSAYNMMVSELKPWYVQATFDLMSMPTDTSNFVDDWVNSHLIEPVRGAAGSLWNTIVKVLGAIWGVIYDIGYFIVEAWPLWVGIGILILILEVKKWNRERKLTKSLSRSAKLLELKEAAEMRRLAMESAHRKKLQEMEEEHQRRLHEAEEKHERKLKAIKKPRAGRKKTSVKKSTQLKKESRIILP